MYTLRISISMQNFKKISRLALCTAFLGILFPFSVHAEDLTVLPRVIDLPVQPRDIVNQKVIIKNESQGTLTYFTFVNNVTVGLEGGVEEFVPPSMADRSDTLSSWIEIFRAGAELGAGQTREIPLTFRVSANAKPGTYHALISFASGANIDEASAKVARNQAPSILVTMTIAKPSNDSLKLLSFVIKKIISKNAPSDISYRLENNGDTELKPTGDILIYNQKGEEVESIPVNPDGMSIKPGESTIFNATVKNQELFGKYKAFLTVRYGSGMASVYDTVYFYLLPWKKLVIGFVILLVSALSLSLWLHHRYTRRRADDTDDGSPVSMEFRPTTAAAMSRDIVIKKR